MFLRRSASALLPKSAGRNVRHLTTGIVNSHNEFDPLEEVIVGRVEGSTIPEWHVSGKAVWPSKYWDMYKNEAGKPFPADIVNNGSNNMLL